MGYFPSNVWILVGAIMQLYFTWAGLPDKTAGAVMVMVVGFAYHHWQHHIAASTGVSRQDVWRFAAAIWWTLVAAGGVLWLCS